MSSPTNNVVFEDGFVAFLDILGFTNHITEAESNNDRNQILADILKILEDEKDHAYWQKGATAANPVGQKVLQDADAQYITISDSIIISVKAGIPLKKPSVFYW